MNERTSVHGYMCNGTTSLCMDSIVALILLQGYDITCLTNVAMDFSICKKSLTHGFNHSSCNIN